MAKSINRLSARTVATLPQPGRHSDGGNLYLVVDSSGARRWVFLFRQGGRLREMGMGGVNAVPLVKARELAAEARALVAAGDDPIAARKGRPDVVPTFAAFTARFLDLKAGGWRNAKHRQQWKNTLATYATPINAKLVSQITTEDVLGLLSPIWQTKPETASRVRGRIEQVLDAARVTGHRGGENPARWRGHLAQLLPKPRKLTRGHHPAMSYAAVPAFIERLRERPAMAALALEYAILTAARSDEVLSATWGEINRSDKLWTVPASRMKGGREHRVPLTARAVAILDQAETMRVSDFLFPGQRLNRPLSSMAMEMLLRHMRIENATPHGFRSSFRDWVEECTSFPGTLAEAALAHVTGDNTERAYRRGDALAKRRELMDAWARFIEAKVVDGNKAMISPNR